MKVGYIKHESSNHGISPIESGQFYSVGNVHFSDEKHLSYLFYEFNIRLLSEKVIQTSIPRSKDVFASWYFVARLR